MLLISRGLNLCILIVQESIPIVKAERVRREMLRGAEIALGLPEGSMPSPFFTKVQLWYARHKFVISSWLQVSCDARGTLQISLFL